MAEVTGSLNFEYSFGEDLRRQITPMNKDGEEIDLAPFIALVEAHLKEVSSSESLKDIPPVLLFGNQIYHRIFGSTSQEDRFSGGNLVGIGVILGAYLSENFSFFKDEHQTLTDIDINMISMSIADSLEIRRGQIAEKYRALEAEAFYPLYQMLEARQQYKESHEDLNSDEG